MKNHLYEGRFLYERGGFRVGSFLREKVLLQREREREREREEKEKREKRERKERKVVKRRAAYPRKIS